MSVSLTTYRGLVQTQFKISTEAINKVKDPDTRSALFELKRTFETMVNNFGSQINDKTTNRRGDVFSGAMAFVSPGTFTLPVYAIDPSPLTDGEIWYNSTSKILKCRENGVTQTIATLSNLTNFVTFDANGSIDVPVVAVDPSNLNDGDFWFNSTSKTFKVRQNGATQTLAVLSQVILLDSNNAEAVPQLSSDPVSPVEGELWYNSTGKVFKIYENGVIQIIAALSQVVLLDVNGSMDVPIIAGDPASPNNGDMWYNSVSNLFRAYQNGAIVTVVATLSGTFVQVVDEQDNLSVVNTNLETTLYTFNLPANTMAESLGKRCLKVQWRGNIKRNAHTFSMDMFFYIGNQIIHWVLGSNANDEANFGEFCLFLRGATNADEASFIGWGGTASTIGTSIPFQIAATVASGVAVVTGLAIDMTAQQTVKITVKPGTAFASSGFLDGHVVLLLC